GRRTVASSARATALIFVRFRGVFRKKKSKSTVVTGAPRIAAAAFPTRTASRRSRCSKRPMSTRNGRASIGREYTLTSQGWPRIRDNVLPLARVRWRDDGDDRLGVADVEHFVRDARLDEDEVARLVLDHVAKGLAVLVAHAPLKDVQHHFESDMDVRQRHP